MKTIFIILFLTVSISSFGGNGLKYATYNVSFGGVVGAVGSAIHKTDKETYGHALLNGFWKGAAGGAVCLGSKYIAREIAIKNNYWYGWPAHITNSIGTSIMTNAFWNKRIYDEYSLDLGFIKFTTDWKHVQPQLLPVSFISTVVFALKYGSFSAERTIKTGIISFNPLNISIAGNSFSNIIVSKDEAYDRVPKLWMNPYQIYGHEFTHVFQSSEYLSIHNFNKKLPCNKWIFYDLPYESLGYLLSGGYGSNYRKSYYEIESNYFGNIK